MAYEYERDEWHSAVNTLTEMGRMVTIDEPRRLIGIIGDPDDDLDDDDPDEDDE